MTTEHHPATYVQEFLEGEKAIARAELSLYSYVPQTVKDERLVISTDAQELKETFLRLKQRLEPEHDVAFHSKMIDCNNQIFHLPVIDLQTTDYRPQTHSKHIPLSMQCENIVAWTKVFLFIQEDHITYTFLPSSLFNDM